MQVYARDILPLNRHPFVSVPVHGVGGIFSSIGSWFTGYDTAEMQTQSAALDAKLQQLNQEAAATGKIDQATYDQTVQHLAAQIAATQSIPDNVDAAFVEGALQGYESELAVLQGIPEYAGKITGDVLAALTQGITRGAGSILGGVFGNLPWWVWVGGAVALFFYLGGGRVVHHQAGRVVRRYSGS